MRAGPVLLALLAVVAAGAAGTLALRGLRFDHNTRSLLRRDAAADRTEATLASDFGAEDILLLAWRSDGLDPAELARIRRIREELSAIDGLEEVYGLGGPEIAVRLEGEFVFHPVRPRDVETPERRAKLAGALRHAPYYGILYNADLDALGVASSFVPAPWPKRRATLEKVREVARRHEAPGRRIHVAGVTALTADAGAYAVQDLRRIGLLALAVSVAVLLVLCRSVRETLVAVAATGLPPLLALGFASAFDIPVTALGAALFPVLAVVGITSSVHLLNAYGEERAAGAASDAAARAAARRLAAPIVLSLSTTGVAFASLRATGVPAFHAGGEVVAVGMFLAIPVVLLGIPAALAFLHLPPPKKRKDAPRLDAAAGVIGRRAPWIAAAATVLAVGGLALLPRADVRVHVLQAFQPESRIARTYRFLEDNLTATVPVDVLLDARKEATEAEIVADLERFDRRAESDAWVHSALSLATLVRYGQRISPIPVDEPAALLVLRSPQFAHVTKRFEDREARRYRIKLRVHEGSPPEVLERLEEAADGLETGTGRLTGLYVRAVGTTRHLVRDLLRGSALMTLLVLATIVVALRSVRLGFAAVVPNVLPVAVVFGGAVLLGWPLDVSSVAVGAVAIGLAVDDTLHVVFRLAAEHRAGCSLEEAWRATRRSVGRALVLSTVVLVAGLSCLAFSAFVPTARFGIFAAAASAVALPADLVVLPAFVRLFRSL